MTRTILAFTTLALFTRPLAAQEASQVELRLREQLRTMMTQLRTLEGEKAALQADKAALDEKVKTVEKTLDGTVKDLAAEREKAKAEGEKLRAEIQAREADLAKTKGELVQAVNFGTKTAEMLKKTEADRAKFEGETIQLKRVVADQRTKNAKMYEISNEVLTRYQKFGLGTALTAREPFTGITRARLESMVEEYGAQAAAQRIKTAEPAKPAPAKKDAPAPSTKRPKD